MAEDTLFFKVLELETRAARVEGLFDADPDIGLIWRSGASLTEACRSVSLEDIHVYEGDVILRNFENTHTEQETARGAMAARELLRFIANPGDLKDELTRAIQRSWQAAVSVMPGEIKMDEKEIQENLKSSLADAPTPLMGALRVAAQYRMLTEGRAPSAERLMFMAAEHTFRRTGQGAQTGRASLSANGLLPNINASWTFLPSVALTQGQFRSWSPASRTGMIDLCDGLRAELDRTLGAIPLMRRWRDQSREKAAGKHGKSRLRDLVELALREPLLSSAHVREMLGVSERTSLYLMKEAEEMGILERITRRQTYRVWVTPHLARSLQMRSMRRAATGHGSGHQDMFHEEQVGDHIHDHPQDQPHNGHESGGEQRDYEESTQAALDELDQAMAKADAILAKYAKPKSEQ